MIMETYPRPDRSAPWAPGRTTGTPAHRIPDGDTVPPYAAGPGDPPVSFSAQPGSTVHVDVSDRWPSTLERALYAAAATVAILTNLVFLWALAELYLILDRLSDAWQQFGEQLSGIGG